MRSSIFSSDLGGPNRAIAVLLAVLFLYLGTLEASTRWLLPKISKGAHRQMVDATAARGLSQEVAAPSILVVGNSLLEAGIVRGPFRETMGRQFNVAIFPIEATSYWDWYFGLRRLFAEGSRPRHVVLTMSVKQLMSNATNGEPFARSMLRGSDLWTLTRAVKLDPMTASNYFFANRSAWLGARTSIRNVLLERWLPGAPSLVARFPTGNAAAPMAGVDIDAAIARLRALREVCAAQDASFTWLVPPSLNPEDVAPTLAEAAAAAHIEVLMPFAPATLTAAEFSDGFHLNDAGAARFTSAAATGLRRKLSPPADRDD